MRDINYINVEYRLYKYTKIYVFLAIYLAKTI